MERIRTKVLWTVIVLALLVIPLAVLVSPWWWLLEILFVPLVLLGIYDYFQPRAQHPAQLPARRPDALPARGDGSGAAPVPRRGQHRRPAFDRDTRSVIYQRAKDVGGKKPFGTEHDVYEAGYSWLNHSVSPRPMVADPENDLRVTVGGAAVHPALLARRCSTSPRCPSGRSARPPYAP